MAPVLELRGITKSFPGVLANDNMDFTLEKGEIHAILGENGAGKTTLMNILYGLYKPDAGEIYVQGERRDIISPSDAIEAGVGMVHQHFMLIPVFTVTENVMLGDEPTRLGGFLDREETAERIVEISQNYKLEVDPDTYIRDLPVGVQQRVEIIKLLYREADILILDEPTAVLTPQESDELFKIMRSLAEQGKSIIFITHKLREVLDAADRITVIRQGKVVGTTTPTESDQYKLAAMMVGREVMLHVEKDSADPQDVMLEVKDLMVMNDRDQLAVNDVSFDVQAGEILGVAGVQGNGQTELVEALTGLREPFDGLIRIQDKTFDYRHVSDSFLETLKRGPIFLMVLAAAGIGLSLVMLTNFVRLILPIIFSAYISPASPIVDVLSSISDVLYKLSLVVLGATAVVFLGENLLRWSLMKEWYIKNWNNWTKPALPRQITELGTAHIPEDRQRDGLVLSYPIVENLALNTYYFPPFTKGVVLQEDEMVTSAVELIESFDIRTPNEVTIARSLSGGNQQKVIVAREFSRPTQLMIAAQPTRGLDVGSIEYIHHRLIDKRDAGVAILLVSTELDEILQLTDRIAVMYRGRIIGVLPTDEATKEKVGLLMAGVAEADTVAQ
jgi:ABC-type uncharacterized transport system ATPase subunit